MDRAQIDALLAETAILNGWVVERFIGEGRFGKVYGIRRENPFGGGIERAALKWVRIAPTPEEIERCPAQGMTMEDLADRYRQKVEVCAHEIEIMRSLQGETNIVNYQDFEVKPVPDGIGWDLFIRMEQLTPLLSYIGQEGLSAEMIVDVGKSVAAALSLCHHPRVGAPVVHGDVKPGNVYFAREHTFKLGDFGLSFLEGRGADSGGGTQGYLAPECVAGAEKTALSDQYALGETLWMLWSLLGGASGTDEGKNDSGAAADRALLQIIQTATAEAPEARYADIDDMLRALNAITEPSAGRVRALTVEEYLQGPGRGGDTWTDLRQREAQREADDVLSGMESPVERTDNVCEEAAGQAARPRISKEYGDWMQKKREQAHRRKGKALFAAIVAVLVLALAAGIIYLLKPAPVQLAWQYANAPGRLYRYKTDYAATAAAAVNPGVSSIWQEVLNSDWALQVSALSADAGNGYGYVLVVSPSGGVSSLTLDGRVCRIDFVIGDAAGSVTERCENATSMLTMNSAQTWLAFDLMPALREARGEATFAAGETYRFTFFLDDEALAIFEGTFA